MRAWAVLLLVAFAGCMSTQEPGSGPGSVGSSSSGDSSSSDTSSSSTTTSCDETCACPYLDGCGIPPFDSDADVAFLLNSSYAVNTTVLWLVRNDGTLNYSAMAPTACSIEVYTEKGRRISMGACYTDVIQATRIPAGQQIQLGSWPAGECTRSETPWYSGRCVEWQPLPPGTYQIRRTFCRFSESNSEDCSTVSRSGAQIILA